MRSRSLNKRFLFLILISQNLFYFLITFLNFNSLRGTDFNKYGKYFDYFYTFENNQIGLESGISYYWFVTKFFNLLKEPLLYSENNLESIKSASIQLANFLLFLIGLLGVHYLLRKTQNFKTENTLPILIILSIFPPLIGARMILKPEILVFCFLPWLLLFYFEYFNKKKIVYLLISIPIIAIILSLKASITFMLLLFLLITLNKNIFDKRFLLFNLFSLVLFSLIINENFLLNGNYLWEHVTTESYRTKAPIEYIYNFNISELWANPYRDTFKNSMISILLADTFGDYWQRYWFHYDGWGIKIDGNTRSKNFPGNILAIRVSILLSLILYFSTIYYLFREKNKKLFYLGISGFIGFLTLAMNAINLLSFLPKNFDVTKGDPMKTHLFSFLLAMTFVYLLIKLNIHKNIYRFVFTLFILNTFFIFMTNPITLQEVMNSKFYIERLYSLIPCILNDVTTGINPLCSPREIIGSTSNYFLPTTKGFIANKLSLISSFLVIAFYVTKNGSKNIF